MGKVLVGTLVVASLAGVGALSYWAGTRSNAPAKAAAAPAAPAKRAPQGLVVEAAKVAMLKLPQSLTAVGSLRSDETVILRPEVAGRISAILFREGERVSKGDVLVRLDDSVQHADLDKARANLTLAKTKFERSVDLRKKGFLSSQAEEESENNLKVAQADAALMQARLSKTVVQVGEGDRRSPADISDIYVRGKNNEMVQLSNLVVVREGVAPKNLNHFNRIRAATITATLAPGYALGDALTATQDAAKKVLPPTVQTDLNGLSREFRDSSTEIYVVFVLALAFIFLVLAAQFESFIDPFIIMFTVPLAMTGALLALWLFGGTLNIYSKIGLVTLVGLITKHGILIVEFANQIQAKGKSVIEAVEEAAVLRLRPILMTTGAMVLGALPLALATGAGAESRQQIGWVIVGGMLVGTLLTLFVVPTAYTLLARRHKTFEERLEQDRAAHVAPAAAD